ncbi:hypothetical protein THAOC_25058, partial [Thalassiosira oceanica]
MPARGGRPDSYDSACSNHGLRISRTPLRHGEINRESPTITREITVDNGVGNYTAAVAARDQGVAGCSVSSSTHQRKPPRPPLPPETLLLWFVGWAVSLARPSTGEEKAEGTAPKIGGVASGKPVLSFGTE